MTLPAVMTTLITRLNNVIDDLVEKQMKMEKVIDNLLVKLDKVNKKHTTTNNIVSTPLSKSPHRTTPLSFEMITARTPNTNNTSLPKHPPQAACLNQTQEHKQFKRFYIVIQTKAGVPKPFEKTIP
ncbi:hypothetical protein O181_020325 [Austropuccinia psidii MF-1]|uniref:Uncharacterized protein n=1 Tax=Austropuccinia psidii MF-1 TaxID=1389203 RepID=A0A9Q3GVZ6_9BASI|nr:hypothetical protein [Austropuccinia psidii MF-1]